MYRYYWLVDQWNIKKHLYFFGRVMGMTHNTQFAKMWVSSAFSIAQPRCLLNSYKHHRTVALFTGVHSNQDHIWLVKIGDYIGFYVDRRSWLLWSPVIGRLRCYQIMLGWKVYKILSWNRWIPQTKGQPIPRKFQVISGIWATLFPQQIFFRGLGLWFHIGNRLQETHPNQILRKRPINRYR